MTGVTLTQLLGRLVGAVKPADSLIFTEACSTDICRPKPSEQSPGNIVGISDPRGVSSAVTIAPWGSGAITGCGTVGCIYLDPLYPSPPSDGRDKSSAMAKASIVLIAQQTW